MAGSYLRVTNPKSTASAGEVAGAAEAACQGGLARLTAAGVLLRHVPRRAAAKPVGRGCGHGPRLYVHPRHGGPLRGWHLRCAHPRAQRCSFTLLCLAILPCLACSVCLYLAGCCRCCLFFEHLNCLQACMGCQELDQHGSFVGTPAERITARAGVVMRSPYRNVEIVVPRDHLTQEPQLVPLLFMHAKSAWHSPGHPGWGLYKHQDMTTTQMPLADMSRYAINSQQVPCFTPSEYAGDAVRAAVGESGATGATVAAVAGRDARGSPAAERARSPADVVMEDPNKRSPSPGVTGRGISPEVDAQRRAQLQSIFSGAGAAQQSAQAAQLGGGPAAGTVSASPPPPSLGNLGLSAGDITWSQLSLPSEFPPAPPPGASWMDTNAIAAHTQGMPGGFGGVVAGMFAGATVQGLFSGTAGATAQPGVDDREGGLVRLRSSLGSAALDVARPERQRLRAGEQGHGMEVRWASHLPATRLM